MPSHESTPNLPVAQSPQIAGIDFHGAVLTTIRDERTGTVYCLPKEISNHLGVDWKSQHVKITNNQVLAKGILIFTIPSAGGPQETLALNVRKLPFWLSTFDLNRIKDPERRATIEVYQEECAEVLANHWLPMTLVQPPALSPLETTKLQLSIILQAMELMERLGGYDDRERLFFKGLVQRLTEQAAGSTSPLALPSPAMASISDRLYDLRPGLPPKTHTAVAKAAGRLCAPRYRQMYGEQPAPKHQYIDGALRPVSDYPAKDWPWIDDIIRATLEKFGITTEEQE